MSAFSSEHLDDIVPNLYIKVLPPMMPKFIAGNLAWLVTDLNCARPRYSFEDLLAFTEGNYLVRGPVNDQDRDIWKMFVQVSEVKAHYRLVLFDYRRAECRRVENSRSNSLRVRMGLFTVIRLTHQSSLSLLEAS